MRRFLRTFLLRTFLLGTTRVLLVAFLLGGLAVVVGQALALAVGSRHLMVLFGSGVTDAVCVVAGAAGTCSFLHLYTQDRASRESSVDRAEQE